MNRTKRVFRNSVFLLIARVWRMGGALLITPYTLSKLGVEEYGLFAVLGTVTQYFGLLDFALGTAFVKYFAEYAALGDRRRVRDIATFGVLFYLALGILLLPIVYLLAPPLVGVLKLSENLRETGVNILLLLFAYYFLAQSVSVLGQLLSGLELMHLTSSMGMVSYVVYAAAVLILLNLGFGIYGVMSASFVQLVYSTAVMYVVARRNFGPLFSNPLSLEWGVIRRMFAFGGWMQVNSLSDLVNTATDRFVIGSFVSVASVTYYDIGNKLALLTKTLPLVALEALLPTISSLNAEGQERELEAVYVQASRWLALMTLLVGGFVVGVAAPLTLVWVGPDYVQLVPAIIALLVLAYFIHNLTGVGTTILRAMGLPRYESYYSALGAALNIAATVALAPAYGLWGVLGGTAIGTILGSVYFLWLFHRIRRISLWTGLGQWLWRLVLSVALATASVWWLSTMIPLEWLESRLEGLALIGVLGIWYLASLSLLLRLTGFLNASDRALVHKVVPLRIGHLLDTWPIRLVFGSAT